MPLSIAQDSSLADVLEQQGNKTNKEKASRRAYKCFIVLLWLLSPCRFCTEELRDPLSLASLSFELDAISFIVQLPAQSSQHAELGGGGEACWLKTKGFGRFKGAAWQPANLLDLLVRRHEPTLHVKQGRHPDLES